MDPRILELKEVGITCPFQIAQVIEVENNGGCVDLTTGHVIDVDIDARDLEVTVIGEATKVVLDEKKPE